MKKILLTMTLLLTVLLSLSAQQTPPATATQESWYFSGQFTSGNESEDVNEPMTVAFDGNDIYFNFPNPITGNTWMKGTRDGQTVTFAKGQRVGTYGGQTIYYMGLEESGLCDIVFSYDETSGLFLLGNMWVALTNSLTQATSLGYFSLVTVTKGGQAADGTLDYVLTGRNVNPNNESQYEELNEKVKVKIDGSTIAIQGLSGYDPQRWLTGTVSNGVATFATRQDAGSYNTTKLYFIGYDGSEKDIVFSYDESSGLMTCEQYILVISAEGVTYQLLTNVMLYPDSGDTPEPQPEVVVPPAGIQVTSYVFTGILLEQDDEGGFSTREVKRNAKVGFYQNQEVYIRGLCQFLPDAWAKATISEGFGGDKDLTFAKGQYYGAYGLYPLYLMANDNGNVSDMKFYYDSQTREIDNVGGLYLVTSVSPTNPMPVEQYVKINLKPGTITGIEGVTAGEQEPGAWYSLQGVRTDQPKKGICIHHGKKIVVR